MKSENSMLCINRIKSVYEDLPKAERAIADFIMEHPESEAFDSCADLAEKTGTSAATVVRFCRRIGFAGFLEMKMSLSKSWLDQSVVLREIKNNDSASHIKQKVLMYNKSVIDVLFETLDDGMLQKAADLMLSASRVMIVGDGGSGCSASVAYLVFTQLGIDCDYEQDLFYQVTAIERMGKGDCMLAFSNSGKTRNTIENLIHAKEKGAATIGVTGGINAPISRYLDIELRTNVFDDYSFCDSISARICENCTISILYSMIWNKMTDRTNSLADDFKKAYDRKRIGTV